jgi:hypothetical protein
VKGWGKERQVWAKGTETSGKGGGEMEQIRDDPIISCMERTGYPPWMQQNGEDDREGE